MCPAVHRWLQMGANCSNCTNLFCEISVRKQLLFKRQSERTWRRTWNMSPSPDASPFHGWAVPAAPWNGRHPETSSYFSNLCGIGFQSDNVEHILFICWYFIEMEVARCSFTTQRCICNGEKQWVYLKEKGSGGVNHLEEMCFKSKSNQHVSHVDAAHTGVFAYEPAAEDRTLKRCFAPTSH